MSEGKTGISKTTFIVGIIVAILASSLISVLATTQLALMTGPKGDKGDKGDIGATGPQGPAGPATTFARWSLAWYNITGTQWGASVGNSTWGAVFDHNFRSNALFGGYSDYIGFQQS
jgi:multidrug efflux pump subunit AcrB